MNADALPLCEPNGCFDVVVQGMAYCQEIAPGMWRVAFYTVQRFNGTSPDDLERAVVARFIVPEAVKNALALAFAFNAPNPAGAHLRAVN